MLDLNGFAKNQVTDLIGVAFHDEVTNRFHQRLAARSILEAFQSPGKWKEIGVEASSETAIAKCIQSSL